MNEILFLTGLLILVMIAIIITKIKRRNGWKNQFDNWRDGISNQNL